MDVCIKSLLLNKFNHIVKNTNDLDEKTQQLTATLTPMFRLVTSSQLSTSGNIAYPSAQIRRNEIITKCETDFLYTSIVELPRWVIILPAGNDDEFWRTNSVI